jgi:predicted transcriptional regulator
MSNWTLFSNHGHVLFCLARNPEARLRDVAADVGITERAVQKIVRDLQDGDMISVTKNGRRNSYRIDAKISLRHELEAACTLKDLIKVVNKAEGPGQSRVVKTGPAKVAKKPSVQAKTKKSEISDHKERQQGSLF